VNLIQVAQDMYGSAVACYKNKKKIYFMIPQKLPSSDELPTTFQERTLT